MLSKGTAAPPRTKRRRASAVAQQAPVPAATTGHYLTADARSIDTILASKGRMVDVTITSPPYWNAKDYGGHRQIGFGQTRERFLEDLSMVFAAIWKHTSPTGSLWLIANTVKQEGRLDLFPFELAERLRSSPGSPWNLEDILIWHKTHTLPWSHGAELPDHFEYIFSFSKSAAFKLNVDAVRQMNGLAKWWVRYPERYHPNGRAPSNVWEIPIPTQGTWGNGHFAHMCPHPTQLAEQIIAMAAPPKGLVLDPFAGTGTTLIAARNQGRRWLGLDTNHNFRQMFVRRLREEPEPARYRPHSSLAATNLKLRQLKYAHQLFKRLASTSRVSAAEIPVVLVLSGKRQRRARPFWIEDCRLVFAVRKARPSLLDRLRDAATELCAKAPLSKYQMETVVEFVSVQTISRRYRGHQLHVYSGGRFWAAMGTAEASELSRRPTVGGFPTVGSDIRVRENGTRWGEV